jgi:signal transduction histidine kinase
MDPLEERYALLAEAATALSGALELDVVLKTIIQTAAQVTGAAYAALCVIGADGAISRFVHCGLDEATVKAIGHLPKGKGLLGLLIRDPRIIRLKDLSEHPASYGFPPNHPPMSTFLGAPVRSGGRVFGNLYLTEKPGGFDETDEQLLLVLAAQAGAAIENAALAAQLQHLAVHSERDRISRELHDGVIQELFSIGMGLESARGLVWIDPTRVAERLDAAIDAIDSTIRDLRNAIFHLRPHAAAALGLTRGLVELAREYEVNALTRPTVDIPSDLDARVDAGLVPDVLQIVREALSNTAKHAGPCAVTISAQATSGQLEVVVRDTGAGFDPGQARAGCGLDNIHERAQVLGACLQVESAPGTGTAICLRVPIKEVVS